VFLLSQSKKSAIIAALTVTAVGSHSNYVYKDAAGVGLNIMV
jgi:hypothetical protein